MNTIYVRSRTGLEHSFGALCIYTEWTAVDGDLPTTSGRTLREFFASDGRFEIAGPDYVPPAPPPPEPIHMGDHVSRPPPRERPKQPEFTMRPPPDPREKPERGRSGKQKIA